MGSTTFDYTGSRQSYTVPDGISQLQVTLYGAGGGNSSGGYVEGTLDVTPGETLYIYVGGSNSGTSGGWPDGGDGKTASGNSNGASSGGGAGSVQIRRSGDTLSDRVAVAGGGGGTQSIYIDANSSDLGVSGPGDGGADTGGSSSSASTSNTSVSGNGGGSQSGGGAGASPNGTDGTGPSGGTGGVATASDTAYASGAGGGGGGGYYGGGAGAADAWVSGSDTGEASANGGAGGSNYTGGLASVASNTQGGGNSGDGQVVLFAETPPQNVDATYVADDQVDLSFDDVDADSYEVQIQRDGGTWEDPAGGPSSFSGGSASYSGSYGPSSDTAYGRQVGIDSSFRFRARATYGGSPSDWAYSDTVYTSPVPPHNPSVSRPDANTVRITATTKSDIPRAVFVEAREDTGSGYGSWFNFDYINAGEENSGSVSTTGSTWTREYTTGVSYQYDSLQEDARYQFRITQRSLGYDYGEPIYTDYGNNGNVYFSDDFESGDFSNWDTTTLSDSASGVISGEEPGGDSGISGADQGTYYAHLESGDSAVKNLGDLSGETDVLVKCAMATGSMDFSDENISVDWYDGSSWHQVKGHYWEHNKQGWVEVSDTIPSSWLSTDNRIRLTGYGGSGDYGEWDRVVVSDVLDEYTKPAAPTNLSLDNSVAEEIGVSWTANTSVLGPNRLPAGQEVQYKLVGGSYDLDVYNESSPHTITGLLDGRDYEVQVRDRYTQYRHGTRQQTWPSTTINGTTTTIVSAPSEPSLDSTTADSASVSWTNNDTAGNAQRRVYVRRTGADGDASYRRTGMNFNGDGDEVITPQIAISGDYSIFAYFRKEPDPISYNTSFRTIAEFDAFDFGLHYLSGNGVIFEYPDDGNRRNITASAPNTGQWYAVAASHSESNGAELYIDPDGGSPDVTGAAGAVYDDNRTLDIGYGGSDRYFPGDIARVAIFDRELSAGEFATLADGGIILDGLLGYWPLDLNQSGTTPDLSTYANDAEVNGPTLTGPTLQDKTGLLSNATSSTSLSGLRNGEEYETYVHSVAEDNEVRNK